MDPNNTSSSNEKSKRQAMQGQWRTPPLPVFPSGAAGVPTQPAAVPPQPAAAAPPPQTTSAAIQLPESHDDYAKALQEAYRRGAEAAAAMQQQQTGVAAAMPNAVSCPNFHQLPTGSGPTGGGPPPPPPPPPPEQQQQQQVLLVPNPLTSTNAASNSAMPPPNNSSTESRSFSLPDIQSYAARAQAEEEKRKKRLARNRASARLRRLRKKNLVDSYEGEVGVLELGLQKLRAHQWGEGHDPSALLEALGMERGQQPLTLEERSKLIESILEEQHQQVQFIRQTQLEQQVLRELVTSESTEDPLLQELQQVLQLSPEQEQALQQATSGLEEEVEAMETLESCLQHMKIHPSLQNDAVHDLTQQFLGIFHPNQVSKFLLWTDNNAEAMDQLDYVHASGVPSNSPIFQFGMDDYGGGVSQLTTSHPQETEPQA